jgi:glycosyltransferase involved in cell wall biosynthesis
MNAASAPALRVFVAFRDTPERRAALLGRAPRWLADPYLRLAGDGVALVHNLATPRQARLSALWARLDAGWTRWAGIGLGDLERAWSVRRSANATDVLVAAGDSAGIPLAALRRLGRVRPPLLYVSIGWPERWKIVKDRRGLSAFYRWVLGGVSAFAAFGWAEAAELRAIAGSRPVHFLPYGVDPDFFSPMATTPAVDVVSLGADPQRDVPLLIRVACRLPHRTFRWIAPSDRLRAVGAWPPNLEVEGGVPPERVREVYASARVVALPVRENTYSGATTTLLQAMAMGRPVVLSRVAAIAEGYGLRDGENVCLVPPGGTEEFSAAVERLLSDSALAADMGRRARLHVERELTMERLADRLRLIVRELGEGRRPTRADGPWTATAPRRASEEPAT